MALEFKAKQLPEEVSNYWNACRKELTIEQRLTIIEESLGLK